MILTGSDLTKNYEAYGKAMFDGTHEGYTFDIQGSFNQLDPLYAIKMLRKSITVDDKEDLCRNLIVGKTVTITLYGEQVIEFMIPTVETPFSAFKEFFTNPTALSFLITATHSQFLKNSVPQLSDSQIAVRDALRKKLMQGPQGD